MKDQVDSLNQIGISATYINSTLSSNEYSQTIKNILSNVYKIIYIAPERLNSDSFQNILSNLNISMFTIDEAHCVSQWGHDFRPSYRFIAHTIKKLKPTPIISAFTATATKNVKNDIINLLHLEDPYILTTGYDRKNLKFCIQTPENKFRYVINYIKKHSNCPGIIYCSTRKNVNTLYEELISLGFLVTKYHGGMNEKERAKNQNDFVFGKFNLMIATNAFGMGINKPNIRYVIHFNMPKDIEGYYQEAGRAGRDGQSSECILLFSKDDIMINKYIIDSSLSKNNHKIEYDKLNSMIRYCHTDKCLRKFILEYFGEKISNSNCGNCSNCLLPSESTDITIEAQKILSCIFKLNGKYGVNLITDILKGTKSSKINKLKLNKISTYGILKSLSKNSIKDLIYFLISEEYIKVIGEKYPVLHLNNSANDILFHNKKIFINRKIENVEFSDIKNEIFKNISSDENIFEIMKKTTSSVLDFLK